MVSLHGCVQTASTAADRRQLGRDGEEYGMVVALPDAPAAVWCSSFAGTTTTQPLAHLPRPPRRQPARAGLGAHRRAALGIDRAQVYLSGLSSGGGETMVMGCLAPDVFAGIGIMPDPPSAPRRDRSASVAVSQAQGTATCRTFAGSASASFSSPAHLGDLRIERHDGGDGLQHAQRADHGGIYGAGSTLDVLAGGLAGTNTAGSGTLYADAAGPRVSLIQNTGLGHNWPAGGGRAARTCRRTASTTPRT
jgi:poly(3-hydroxybutyrate) depolymerase